MRSDKINMFKFATLSAAIHMLGLAHWPTPIMLTYGAEKVLSVRFFLEMSDDVTSAATKPAATSRERLAKENAKRPQFRHARDNERDSNFGPPTRIRTAAKPEVNKTLRAPKYTREDGIVMQTAAPVPFPEPPKAGPFAATRHQQPPLDKPIAMSSMVKLDQPVTPANTIAGGDTKSASAHIRGKLRTDLARYFSYPAIARQRGWQGHVQIRFRVQPDGKLTNIYIARSSGYRLLDKSALKALRQVEPLVEAATLLNGKSVDMELPVIYKLEQP
ncbi:MAG: energy transducer TonB [Gammaproteobacteria bacterium]|nr:energy transducer TonB [Gammaproteobacteria bacterium]